MKNEAFETLALNNKEIKIFGQTVLKGAFNKKSVQYSFDDCRMAVAEYKEINDK